MKHIALTATLLVTLAHGAAAATSHEERMWRVVLDSSVLFHDNRDDGNADQRTLRQLKKAARLRFHRMSRRKLGHTLHATLAALPPRSAARQAVAYIAAIHGFNVDVNAQRIMNTGLSEPSKIWGHNDVHGLAADRYERVHEIYLRHPSRHVLKMLFHERSDGAGEEALNFYRAKLLRREPRAVMTLAGSDALALERFSLGTVLAQRAVNEILFSRSS